MGIFDFLFSKPAAPVAPTVADPASSTSATGVAAMTAAAAAAVASQTSSAPQSTGFILTAAMLERWTGRTDSQFYALAAAFNKAVAGTLINGKMQALTSDNEIKMFLAQSLYESMGFSSMTENLYYSKPDRIAAVWPTRFNYNGQGKGPLNAADYTCNPSLLANCVYAARGGNGNVASGDGYLFRGRGVGFNITFRGNYDTCSKALYGDDRLTRNPDLVASDFDVGFATGMWFWVTNGLGALVAAQGLYGSLDAVTAKINGSTASAPQRKVWLDKITQS